MPVRRLRRRPDRRTAAATGLSTRQWAPECSRRRLPVHGGTASPRGTSPAATAAAKINELLVEENKSGSGLRVFVQGGGCSGFQYGLMIEENGQGAADQVYESHGVKLFVDPISVRYLNGAEVDFVDTVTGGGF